jgi:hypothetical protein
VRARLPRRIVLLLGRTLGHSSASFNDNHVDNSLECGTTVCYTRVAAEYTTNIRREPQSVFSRTASGTKDTSSGRPLSASFPGARYTLINKISFSMLAAKPSQHFLPALGNNSSHSRDPDARILDTRLPVQPRRQHVVSACAVATSLQVSRRPSR